MEYLEITYSKPRRHPRTTWTDEHLQIRINAVKRNLKMRNGYNDQSATDVMNHVAVLLAKGE